MAKINLLPPERIKAKRAPKAPSERSYLWLVIALPLLVLLLMLIWWFSMGSSLNSKEEELATAKKELADLQAKNQALQQYKTRKDQITQIEDTVVKALSGRVYWARILNNIAIMCPTDIWLKTLNGTSEGDSGSVTFEGSATQCPNRLLAGFFPGMRDYHPDYKPIAYWIDRMGQIEQFQQVWLSTAEPAFVGTGSGTSTGTTPGTTNQFEAGTVVTSANGSWVIKFSSTATLNMKTAALGTPTATKKTAGEQ